MGEIAEAANLLEQAMRLNPEERGGQWLCLLHVTAYLVVIRTPGLYSTFAERTQWPGPTLRLACSCIPFKDRAVADRFADGLIKAGLPPGKIAGGYFPAFKENQLTGEEIKRLNFGSNDNRNRSPMASNGGLTTKKNGEFTWRGGVPISSDTGKTRIDGDMECTQFQKNLWGLEFCQTVFRNPRGTYEGKDEYFSCTDFGFVPWSVVR